MAPTGQLAVAASQPGNIELGGSVPLVSAAQYPVPIFEMNFTDDPISCHEDVVKGCFPTAYYRLNELSGTSAVDQINARNGAYTGGFTLNTAGALADSDPSVLLNGTTGYVSIGNYSNAFNLTAAYSYSVWAYPTATRVAVAEDPSCVVSYQVTNVGAGVNNPFFLAYGRGDSLGVPDNRFWCGYYNQAGGGYTRVIDTSDVTLNTWVHFVVTYDAASTTKRLVLYRNGVEVGHNNSLPLVVAGDAAGLTFLGLQWNGGLSTDEFFPGRIDDFAFFNRTLTQVEAAKLYASGSVKRNKENGYVDYSTRVRGFSSRRGRQNNVDRVEAGTLTILLDNTDGALNPNPASGIIPMRQARLKCRYGSNTYPIMRGYIESYKYLYAGSGKDSAVELTISDGFKVLSQQQLTGFTRSAELPGPRVRALLQSAAIPFELQSVDDSFIYPANLAPVTSGATEGTAASVVLTGTLSDGSAVVTGLSSTSLLAAGMAVTGTGIPTGATILQVDSGTQVTLALPANISASKTVKCAVPPPTTVLTEIADTSDLSVGMAIDLGLDRNNAVVAQPGTTIASIDSGSQVTMSLPTYNGITLGPDQTATATFTTGASQSLTFLESNALNVTGALQHIRDIEATELGLFLVTGDGKYLYQGNTYRDGLSIVATFNDTVATDIPYIDLPVSYDETNIGNEYIVTNTFNSDDTNVVDPTSIRQYFPRTVTLSQLWRNNFALVNQRTQPYPRTDSMQIKPAADPTRLWPLILDLEISDKIDIQRHPLGGSDVLTGYAQHVEGIQHDARPGDWTVTLNTSPVPG